MIKAVIFDFDGVIVDSHGTINKLFTEIINKELGLGLSKEEFAKYPGLRFDERVVLLSKEKGINIDPNRVMQVINKGRELYFSNFLVMLFPGVLDLLGELKKNKIKIGLATNGSKKTVYKQLKQLNIFQYFDSIVTYDDVTYPKPKPEMFFKICTKLNVKPKECVMVEDAPAGIIGAKKAGMKVIALSTTMPRASLVKADLIMESIKEITLDKLKSLES